MFNNDEIKNICSHFNIDCIEIKNCIDSSRTEQDKRFNYEIEDISSKKYFLKINNDKNKIESFLKDIERLIKNYKSIGLYCPDLLKTKDNTLSYNIQKDGINYVCHIEEKAAFAIKESQNEVDYFFKIEALKHVGIFANKFTNQNLSETKSMWALELSESNKIDEKQENLNKLITCLKKKCQNNLVNELIKTNKDSREKIKSYEEKLPKCVYQGDLNDTNILVDEQNKFRGIIDFNMFGTEININYFLNESMYYLTEHDFLALEVFEIYTKMARVQETLLSSITENYKLNKDELEVKDAYNKIIYTSFFPNVMLMIYLIENNIEAEKVINLLNLICMRFL